MMPFQRILFPVDFSEATIAMVPSVIEMARRFDAAVTVLNAFNLVRDYSLAPSFEDTGDSEPPAIQYSPALQKLRDQRERSLDEFARRQFSNLSHSVKIEDGDPALVIQWTVQRENTRSDHDADQRPGKIPPFAVGIRHGKGAPRRHLPGINKRSRA